MNILSSMLNYLLTKAQAAASKIGTATMTTTATTLTEAVNELDSKRRNNIAAGYTSEAKNLLRDYSIVPMASDYVVGDSFVGVSDGGYRATKNGTVLVSASCNVAGINAGDVVTVGIGRYNNGWVYESYAHFMVGVTAGSCDVSTFAMGVLQNDIIYLRARNMTAARGSVTAARIVLEYV